jgi:hypothetical protein
VPGGKGTALWVETPAGGLEAVAEGQAALAALTTFFDEA